MEFEESSKSIRWRALMETYQTAKFDRSLKNLSGDIVLTDQCPEQTKKKKKTVALHLHADLKVFLVLLHGLGFREDTCPSEPPLGALHSLLPLQLLYDL